MYLWKISDKKNGIQRAPTDVLRPSGLRTSAGFVKLRGGGSTA